MTVACSGSGQRPAGITTAERTAAVETMRVTPPEDGDEALRPMRFVLHNGSSELRAADTTCHVLRIRTNTTSSADNQEPAASVFILEPNDTVDIHCDPVVFLDPGRIQVQDASVAILVEYSLANLNDRQYARFLFNAERDASDRLVWRAAGAESGPIADRRQ